MWVKWFFIVGAVKASVLAAMTLWAMGETINRTELKLMPMKAAPVERAGQWTPPAERLADIIDEMTRAYGAKATAHMLMQQAHRVTVTQIEPASLEPYDDRPLSQRYAAARVKHEG